MRSHAAVLVMVAILIALGYLFTTKYSITIQTKQDSAEKSLTGSSGDNVVNPFVNKEDINQAANVNINPFVNEVDINSPDSANITDCIKLPQTLKRLVFCLHPVSYLSEEIRHGRLYEREYLHNMERALLEDPGLSVVDIGANLGLYTVWAAALRRPVVAVEMLEENVRRIQQSLKINHLQRNITILNNAMMDERKIFSVTLVANNIGESLIDNKARTNTKQREIKSAIKVKAICLDDLVPFVKTKSVFIKMDIEGSEHKVLSSCANIFFEKIHVKILQTEWKNRAAEEVIQINSFMKKHDYTPSLDHNRIRHVDLSGGTIPSFNVYFLSRKYVDSLE